MRLFLLAAGIIPILFFSCATIEKQESGVDSNLIEGNVVENQQSASHSLESDLQSSEKSTQEVFEAAAVDIKIPPAENSDISGGKRQQTEESRLVKEDREPAEPTEQPVRRYFRPTAENKTFAAEPVRNKKEESASVQETKRTVDLPQMTERESDSDFIADRSNLQNSRFDSFYFSAMQFRFDTGSGNARLLFEHAPIGAAEDLIRQTEFFQTFFPAKEFVSLEERQIAVTGGGIGIEVVIQTVTENFDFTQAAGELLSLLLQRPVEIARYGAICQFSFACDPVMTFSSPNSYGMYTNKGGERVTLSFNLENDREVWFRLAY